MNDLTPPLRRTRKPQKRAEATKRRLMDAAIKGFSALGYDGTTVVGLEQAAGVQRGVLAYHFGSKDALWRQAIDRLFARMEHDIQAVARAARALPDFDPLEVTVGGFVRFSAEVPELQRMIFHQSQHGGPRMEYLTDRHIKRVLKLLEGPMGHAMSAHDYYIYIGAVTAPFASPYEAKGVWNADQYTDEFLRTHTRLVADILRGMRRNAQAPWNSGPD